MQSIQDKINLWLYIEALEGRRSRFEELSETEANILVQRFATDVDHVQTDEIHHAISIEKLKIADGYKLKVETAEGIELRFKPAFH